jgi:hypothetical protein
MLSTDKRDAFNTDGYIILRQFFEPAQLDPVRALIAQSVDTRARTLFEGGQITNLHKQAPFEQRWALIAAEYLQSSDHEPLSQNWGGRELLAPAIHALYTDPRLLDAVATLLGPELTANGDFWVRPKIPADPSTTFTWHQDSFYYGGESSSVYPRPLRSENNRVRPSGRPRLKEPPRKGAHAAAKRAIRQPHRLTGPPKRPFIISIHPPGIWRSGRHKGWAHSMRASTASSIQASRLCRSICFDRSACLRLRSGLSFLGRAGATAGPQRPPQFCPATAPGRPTLRDPAGRSDTGARGRYIRGSDCKSEPDHVSSRHRRAKCRGTPVSPDIGVFGIDNVTAISLTTAAVPEPATVWLLASGLGALEFARCRCGRKRSA